MGQYLDQPPPRHLTPDQRREWHVEQRRRLSEDFGGIDREVEQEFYRLPDRELDGLLRRYGQRYGCLAEEYARETFPLWKSGRRRMSGQTARRLLELVPPLLPAHRRLELIRQLRARCLHRSIRCRVTPGDWRRPVERAVADLVAGGRTARLPENLVRLASWLADEDSARIRPLLLRIEEEEARLRTALLAEEFRVLHRLAAAVRARGGRVTHTIELPTGSVVVDFHAEVPAGAAARRPEPRTLTAMQVTHSPNALEKLRGRQLLDLDLEGLPDTDRRELQRGIVEQRLRLEGEARAAEQRFAGSVHDMQNVIDLTSAMNELDKDFEIHSRFRMASGETDLRVRHTPDRDLILTLAGVAALALLAALLL